MSYYHYCCCYYYYLLCRNPPVFRSVSTLCALWAQTWRSLFELLAPNMVCDVLFGWSCWSDWQPGLLYYSVLHENLCTRCSKAPSHDAATGLIRFAARGLIQLYETTICRLYKRCSSSMKIKMRTVATSTGSLRAHIHVVGMLRFMFSVLSNRACPLLSILFLCLFFPDSFLPYWSFQLYISLWKSPSALI